MSEEIETQPEEKRSRWKEQIKLHKFKILDGFLGVLVFAGAVFGAYKLCVFL